MQAILQNRQRERGTALIIALAIIVLLAGLATTLLFEMQTRNDRSEADIEDIKSFEAAEAGIDAALMSLNTGGNGCLGIGWTSDLNGNGFPDSNEVATGGWYCGAPAAWTSNRGCDGVVYSGPGYVAPPGMPIADSPNPRPQPEEFDFYVHAIRMGDIRFYTYAIPWGKDNRDNDGNGKTDTPTDTGEGDWYTIYATGFSDEYLARLSQNPNNPIGRFTTVEIVARKLASQFQVQAALSIYAKPHP